MVHFTFEQAQQRLLADLAAELPVAVRMQHATDVLQTLFRASAVCVLRLRGDHLQPVAAAGLSRDVLGRRFAVRDHPRLAAVLAHPGVLRFAPESPLPDPYDGLIDGVLAHALAVHDCVGAPLDVDGRRWGVVTLDSTSAGHFDAAADRQLAALTPLLAAAARVSELEAALQALHAHPSAASIPAAPERAAAAGDEIVGHSPPIAHLLHELDVVADTDLPVLLLGETGVGKELVAHRLHWLSPRRARPLVHVNCAALPETLAESELFGHVRGAFTGAVGERPGRFEAADGGTLFLDEVGELPLSIQAKLLRTLQNGEIQRLGADRPRRVNVRVIAATNRALRERVAEGAFRADLYHRLSVYPIPIPPLRERGADVLLLAGRFLEINRARLGLRGLVLTPDAEEALRRYRWPGNVRELEHVVSRAALKALSRGADRRGIVALPPALLDLDLNADVPGPAPAPLGEHAGADAARDPTLTAPHEAAAPTLRTQVERTQRQAIRQALAGHGGNWAAAARALDVDASNLHKLARRLGVKV